MKWLVIVTFMFSGRDGVIVSTRSCPTQHCVQETIDLAQQDPAVIRYQVVDGRFIVKETGNPVFPALQDVWKS